MQSDAERKKKMAIEVNLAVYGTLLLFVLIILILLTSLFIIGQAIHGNGVYYYFDSFELADLIIVIAYDVGDSFLYYR